MELDKCIKKFSLIYTNTITKLDFCYRGFDLSSIMLNDENSISLYALVENFNKLHLNCKKEYNDLDKFELGKHIEIGHFTKYNDNHRYLLIYIDEPIFNNEQYANLYLEECDNEICSYITNDINPLDSKYYQHEICLDKKRIKEYLDLFEKYSVLLYLYNHFKNEMVFGDGIHTLFTEIKSENGEFLDNLKKFKFFLGANYFTSADFLTIYVNLGENFCISTTDCKLEIDNSIISSTEENCLKILKNVFINERYLNTYWDRVDHKEKICAKSLIKKTNFNWN